MMDRDPQLGTIWIRGEVSNYKRYGNGFIYFSIKDSESTLPCIMFPGESRYLQKDPKNGAQVLATGKVTAFLRDGKYQLQCRRLIPEGTGDLHAAFEQMKAKLAQEGLFDESHKKPIPRMPRCIALITSPKGKVVRDMTRILRDRWPMTRVRLIPVTVQGEGAAENMAAAIRFANNWRVGDLLIVGRGGGTEEDLWAFNEEVLARAIYNSTIPVISAVGHEPDVTISDYVADVRATTPTNASELAVPDQKEIRSRLNTLANALQRDMQHRLRQYRQVLERLANSNVMTDPTSYFRDKRQVLDLQRQRLCSGLDHCITAEQGRLDRLKTGLPHGAERTIAAKRQKMGELAASLDALSPLKVLARGYSIAKTDAGILRSVEQVQPGDPFLLRLSDGSLDCQVVGPHSDGTE